MTKQVIFSPSHDARSMFHDSVNRTVNRWNAGRRRSVYPVFKSQRQRKSFKKASITARRAIRLDLANNPWLGGGVDPRRQPRAINRMNYMSQPSVVS